MLCLCFNTLLAANMTYRGVVRDDSGSPLEFANIALLSSGDSTLIGGAVTDEKGYFAVIGDGAPVLLRISAMGFEEKTINASSG